MLLSSSTPPPPFHITQYFMLLPPSLSSRIKWYCLYTPSIYHPISHFPRLVYLPWVLGRHEGTLSCSFPLSHPPLPSFFSLLPSNHCWLLVAIDIRRLIKPWRSCLIYAGGVWVVLRKSSKDTSHLLQYLLSYSPGSGEAPARGSFCQMLDLASCFTFCSPLDLVINVCKCCAGGDKNKHSCGISWGNCAAINDSLLPQTACLYVYLKEKEIAEGKEFTLQYLGYDKYFEYLIKQVSYLTFLSPTVYLKWICVTGASRRFFFPARSRFSERTSSAVRNWQFFLARVWFCYFFICEILFSFQF